MRFPFLPDRCAAAARLSIVLMLATGLAGCDKCGDYFWIDRTTPHSCKDGAASR